MTPPPPPAAAAAAGVEVTEEGGARKPLSPLRSGERQSRRTTFSEERGEKEEVVGEEEEAEAEEAEAEEAEQEQTAEGEITLDEEEEEEGEAEVEEEEAAEAAEAAAGEAVEEEAEAELSRRAGRHLLLQRAVHAWQCRLPSLRCLPAPRAPLPTRLVPCGHALGAWRAHCLRSSRATATQPSPDDEAVELLQVWGAAGTSPNPNLTLTLTLGPTLTLT